MAKKETISKAEFFELEADAINAAILTHILWQIRHAADNGRYQTRWMLPRHRRGYRIPQNMEKKLNELGFNTTLVDSFMQSNTVGGIDIRWGV